MSVDYVKLRRPFRNRFQQQSAGRARIGMRAPKAQRAWPDRVKIAARLRIAAGKQGDFVPQFDEFVDEPGDHPLRAAV